MCTWPMLCEAYNSPVRMLSVCAEPYTEPDVSGQGPDVSLLKDREGSVCEHSLMKDRTASICEAPCDQTLAQLWCFAQEHTARDTQQCDTTSGHERAARQTRSPVHVACMRAGQNCSHEGAANGVCDSVLNQPSCSPSHVMCTNSRRSSCLQVYMSWRTEQPCEGAYDWYEEVHGACLFETVRVCLKR